MCAGLFRGQEAVLALGPKKNTGLRVCYSSVTQNAGGSNKLSLG